MMKLVHICTYVTDNDTVDIKTLKEEREKYNPENEIRKLFNCSIVV